MVREGRAILSLLFVTCLACGRSPTQTRAHYQVKSAVESKPPSWLALTQSEQALDLSVDVHANAQERALALDSLTHPIDRTTTGVGDEVVMAGGETTGQAPGALLHSAPRLLRLYGLNDRSAIELPVYEDGTVAEEYRTQLEHFFRCQRTQRTHRMAEGVLKILYAVDREFPDHVLEIVSGYRSFPYGVRRSKHFEGHAVDLRVRGVRTSRVRDFVWSAFTGVGVGYYGHQNFVHVDYRPERKDTAWTSPRPNAAYAYNPRWALRLRPPSRARMLTDE